MTPERWRALRWFADHAVDVNKVMKRKQPTARMRNLMLREGQLAFEPIAFGQKRFVLSEKGQAVLASKWKRKKA